MNTPTLKDVSDLVSKLNKDRAKMFDGIPVNIDTRLTGLQYCISVSPELFHLIAEHRLEAAK